MAQISLAPDVVGFSRRVALEKAEALFLKCDREGGSWTPASPSSPERSLLLRNRRTRPHPLVWVVLGCIAFWWSVIGVAVGIAQPFSGGPPPQVTHATPSSMPWG